MKHLNKVFAGAAVLVLLTGCDLFKHSISAEQYQEKVDKLEAHQYSEAVVTVKEQITGTGMYAETAKNDEETVALAWNAEINDWEAQDDGDNYFKYYVFTLKGKKVDDVISVPDNSNLDIKTTYYSNLEVKVDIKGSMTVETLGMEVKYNKYTMNYKFDKYGWVTSSKIVCDLSATALSESGTQKTTRTITVSYK